jgi:hypothetical protein
MKQPESPSGDRGTAPEKKKSKSVITRRLKPMVEKSRVLKFGIRGLTLKRERS